MRMDKSLAKMLALAWLASYAFSVNPWAADVSESVVHLVEDVLERYSPDDRVECP